MGKCRSCDIEILDEARYCPLCRSILEQTEEVENMYPDVRIVQRRLLIFSRIYLFCAIVMEVVLVGINLLGDYQTWWSVIAGLILLYIYMVLRYAIIGSSGYKSKVVILFLIGVLTCILIDLIIGYRGWSIDYVVPAGIVLMDVVILGCMIYNHRNWQSYIMWQIGMILASIVPAGLRIMEIGKDPYTAFLPLTISLALFLGTMIIGGGRARVELKRRFHI